MSDSLNNSIGELSDVYALIETSEMALRKASDLEADSVKKTLMLAKSCLDGAITELKQVAAGATV